MAAERRQMSRRHFSYYMYVLDEATGKLIGHFSDISPEGFKLDSTKPVPVNKDFRLRVEQTGEISNKSYITFTARAKWCAVDAFDPTTFNVGFQITQMAPVDHDVFEKMFTTYGVMGR
jgi:hypothetical protein